MNCYDLNTALAVSHKFLYIVLSYTFPGFFKFPTNFFYDPLFIQSCIILYPCACIFLKLLISSFILWSERIFGILSLFFLLFLRLVLWYGAIYSTTINKFLPEIIKPHFTHFPIGFCFLRLTLGVLWIAVVLYSWCIWQSLNIFSSFMLFLMPYRIIIVTYVTYILKITSEFHIVLVQVFPTTKL